MVINSKKTDQDSFFFNEYMYTYTFLLGLFYKENLNNKIDKIIVFKSNYI